MSDLNKGKASDDQVKEDFSKTTSAAADSSGALVKQAYDEMMRGRNSEPNGGSDKSGGHNSPESSRQHGESRENKKNEDDKSNDGRNPIRDKTGPINDQITSKLEKMKYELYFRPTKDGVTEMKTGDSLVKDGDREILFMPNGDKLTVNKDGSFDLKAKGPVEVHKQGDTTTIKYPNGDTVSFGKNGVESITRGNVTVDILDKPNRLDKWPDRLPTPSPRPEPWPEPWPVPYPNPRPEPFPLPHPEPQPYPIPDHRPHSPNEEFYRELKKGT